MPNREMRRMISHEDLSGRARSGLQRYLRNNPGCTRKQLIAAIQDGRFQATRYVGKIVCREVALHFKVSAPPYIPVDKRGGSLRDLAEVIKDRAEKREANCLMYLVSCGWTIVRNNDGGKFLHAAAIQQKGPIE